MTLESGEPTYEHSVHWAPTPQAGALAGFIASIPMGLVMIGLNRLLSQGSAAPEPPKEITAEMAHRANVEEVVPSGRKWGLSTWLGHLGYGAAAASLYPATAHRMPLPDVVSGMLFGLMVWAGSYMGWLPAFNVLPPANQQSSRRNAIMIFTHLIWGSLTGLLVKRFVDQARFDQ